MSNRVERLMRRRTVDAFIQADEFDIVLTRPVKVDMGNGGWREAPGIVLPAQKFRLVPFKRRLTHQESNTQDGPIPVLPYVLVSRPDADVERDDEFVFQDRDCKVIGVEPSTGGTTDDRIVVEFEMR